MEVDDEKLTTRERNMIHAAVRKHVDRIRRFLRVDEVEAKMERRKQQRKKKLLR